MPAGNQKREAQFQLVGWGLFLVCSIFFIADSIAARNPLGVAASLIFLLGCVVFLIPLIWGKG